MPFEQVKHRQQGTEPASAVLFRPPRPLRTHTALEKSPNHSEITKPAMQTHATRHFLEGRRELLLSAWTISPSRFFCSSQRQQARLRCGAEGPAHDKTKRLNDLWMWLSTPTPPTPFPHFLTLSLEKGCPLLAGDDKSDTSGRAEAQTHSHKVISILIH